ncbi:MAG: glycosyltransferase family 2 protein [bacterium]|nr:glycosyltransferase family 2 protein [bacterium]
MPFVSVIIPCRNEEEFIAACLDSIASQDYPKEEMDVMIVDGMSEDKTREIAEEKSSRYPFIRVLSNKNKFTPFGLNIGVKAARGEVIVRMDAHARYEKDYISKCVEHLTESKADNVGGVIKTLPKENTPMAQAIAYCLSSFFGAGGSYFRTGSESPRWVDTVFGGCYKKEVFEKIGLFDERLIRSQDIEFNRRLVRAGGKILLVPEIISYYYPQSTFKKFLRHNFSDGIWTILPLKYGVKIFSRRHLLPLIFVSGLLFLLLFSLASKFFFFLLLLTIILYLSASFLFSLKIVLEERKIKPLFYLPLAFANRHFGYGAGSLFALFQIRSLLKPLFRQFVKKQNYWKE